MADPPSGGGYRAAGAAAGPFGRQRWLQSEVVAGLAAVVRNLHSDQGRWHGGPGGLGGGTTGQIWSGRCNRRWLSSLSSEVVSLRLGVRISGSVI